MRKIILAKYVLLPSHPGVFCHYGVAVPMVVLHVEVISSRVVQGIVLVSFSGLWSRSFPLFK